MKLRNISIALCLWLCILLCGCGLQKAQTEEKIEICASFYPIYLLALEVTDGAEGIIVENMAQPQTGCLHDYQMTIADRKKLETADLFLINGLGMESFLEEAVAQCPQLKVVDTSVGTEPMAEVLAHSHAHEGEEETEEHDEKEEVNAHIWLSATEAVKQAELIAAALCEIDPEQKEVYLQNAEQFAQSMQQIASRWEVAEKEDIHVAIFHEGFSYLAVYGGMTPVIGLFPEENDLPTAKELAAAVEEAQEEGIVFFLAAEDAGLTYAELLAKETDGKVLLLDPITSGTGEKGEFCKRMEQNLKTISLAAKEAKEGGAANEHA